MSFKIINGTYCNYDEVYPSFKKDFYNRKITVDKIREKYKLSRADYRHLRQMVMDEDGVDVKPSRFVKYANRDNPDKYLRSRDGVYSIYYNHKYYGQYKDLDEARKERDNLIANNWKKEKKR